MKNKTDLDTLNKILSGKTVSMDVSTGEHDALNRIFGTIQLVQEDASDEFTMIAIEESRNFK